MESKAIMFDNIEEHREASKKIAKAYQDLLTAITKAPDNCNITIRIEFKGGELKSIPDFEYLIIKPMISLGSDYERLKSRL
jgi:hypothetical protein